ncbi:MAG: hypothetical protein JXR94_24645 [Candidatus Hydrogenedentes bacterium]|nr:hypothetical protein [Candidatus Hydrogenedentota bacterium]
MFARTLAAAGLAAALGAGGAWTQEPPPAEDLPPEDFVIMPWGGSPSDPDTLREIRACGFNLAGFITPDGVEAVAQAGLKCIVIDGRVSEAAANPEMADAEVENRLNAVAGPLKGHPAVFGYYLRDEPNASLFPNLARCASMLNKMQPEVTPYINLYPNYASAKQLGTDTYEAYLEAFVSAVHPTYISYDHYALMADGSLRDSYFQNLEAVRNAALRHGIPFWNIILSNSHFHYAEPSPAGFRFQVYTTLAYGARGVCYFTYLTPRHGNYRLGPIDQFGHKTATWDMVRDVNLQIRALAPTYLTLTSVNVFHHPGVPEGCTGIATSKHLKSVSGKQLLVGEFEGPKGQPFVMVVNTDLHHSTPFDVEFKGQGGIFCTSAYTGATGAWGGEGKWLAPGQGMLLSLRP